jgi:hypothetical protein
VWLNEHPSALNRRYRFKLASRLEHAELRSIKHRVNINTLEQETVSALEMNAIGLVHIEISRPIAFDPYTNNRATGSFVLIDAVTNATVAAGMITRAVASSLRLVSAERHAHSGPVTAGERAARRGHVGAWIRFGGREDAVWHLERLLFNRGCIAVVMDRISEETAHNLVRAGLLVLSAGNPEEDFSVETADGRTNSKIESLPPQSPEAAIAIEQLLERLQILFSTSYWSDSSGI